MSTAIGRYKDYLNEQHMSLDSYTTQRLKLRLNKHCVPSAIRSHYIRASVLDRYIPSRCHQPYKCNAAATERVLCEQPLFEKADRDRVKLLYHAAKFIKYEITDASVPQGRTSSMAHSSMPQFRRGAVLVCRSFVVMSIWRMHFV